MTLSNHDIPSPQAGRWQKYLIMLLCVLLLCPADAVAAVLRASDPPETPSALREIPSDPPGEPSDSTVYVDERLLVPVGEATVAEEGDSILTVVVDPDSPYAVTGRKEFNPDPTRAVWMSALFPGLGQVYNRRYWKLPIVVGGFMGLGYATSWNAKMLNDYTQGYRDLTDSDPSTKSYMNFFPPNASESDIDVNYLTSYFRQRRDYFRRNRDLCIICVVGLYLLCMVDAYVDASLSHFDISDNLSLDVAPAVIGTPSARRPALGLNWALTF